MMARELPLLCLAAVLAAALALEWLDPAPGATPVPEVAERRAPARPAAAERAEEDIDAAVTALTDRPPLAPGRRGTRAPAASGTASAEDLPRLAGVLHGPDGAVALFAPAAGPPLRRRAGETIGRYTIQSISPGEVMLTGEEGDTPLRPRFTLPTTPPRTPGTLR